MVYDLCVSESLHVHAYTYRYMWHLTYWYIIRIFTAVSQQENDKWLTNIVGCNCVLSMCHKVTYEPWMVVEQ